MGTRSRLIFLALIAAIVPVFWVLSARVASSTQDSHASHVSLGDSRLALSVRGNQIVNSHGQTVQLTGFNNSGAEYACEEGWGIFDTPDTAVTGAMVSAMKSWTGANTVRLPVDEQCWLGLHGISAAYGGLNYQRAIERYVSMLTRAGFAVILDLAGTAPGTEMSANQEEMPDAHSVAFWQSAARIFGGNQLVLFDLFNEPWPDNDGDSAAAWECWLDGGCVLPSQNGPDHYTAVGMQQLVDTVRATGAHNILIAEGIQYAETVDQWLRYRPYDPDGNLVSSVHVYSFNECSNLACYNGAMKTVAASVPMVIGEFGPSLSVPYTDALDNNCPSSDIRGTSFDATLLNWANANGASWVAWSWNSWGDCWSLIRNFNGTPTSPYGQFVKAALAERR
jgi:endoglucanase